MSPDAEFVTQAVLIGAGGSVTMDAWALLLRRAFKVQGLDYALLGRWIGHFPRRRFVHERIAAAAPVRGERALGWLAHYLIGIAFAMLLLALAGRSWARSPTLLPPLLVGLGTVVAPWFLMQPAMGAGFAASKTPHPGSARLRNLATHAVFGVGLYASAWIVSPLWP